MSLCETEVLPGAAGSSSHREAVTPNNDWVEYDRLKADLPQDLTEQQYEQACKQIADELGI